MTMQNNQNMNQGNTTNTQNQSIYRQQNNGQMQQPSQMYIQNPNYRNNNNKKSNSNSKTVLGIIGGFFVFILYLEFFEFVLTDLTLELILKYTLLSINTVTINNPKFTPINTNKSFIVNAVTNFIYAPAE